MATEKQPARGAAQSRASAVTAQAKTRRKAASGGQTRKSKTESDTADDLSAEERRKVEKSQPPRPLVLHEVIRLQGNHELDRTLAALWWSALAAGLTIGLSLMAMGLFRARLPDHDMAVITTSLGYPVGFLAIILARQQLFTENTLTAVLPVMSEPTLEKFGQLLRLWSVVLLGNVVGALLFAYGMLHLPIFDTKADQAFLEIGREVMENDHWQMFSKGIVSGWMIATMVWLVPAAENAKVWIIFLVTYLMALGSFSHIVVGTCEVGYLMFAGEVPASGFVLDFALPTLAGNIVGGSLIFALMSHAQVRSDSSSPPENIPEKKTAP